MVAGLLAGASLLLATQQAVPQVPAQAVANPPESAQEAEPTVLSDVVVDGRRVEEVADAFVEAVAAPARRRGLARWNGRLCVGVVNVGPEVAQPLIDHITNVALNLGLRTGEPGCTPNAVIVFADNGSAMATALVEQDRHAFHLGVGGLDRGKVALEAFQTTDRPVRWWHVSMPVIGNTGRRAIRMPGDTGPIFVPGEGIVNRGRPITDSLNKVIVIVDIHRIQPANLAQLGDYLALVTLAQVDLEGSTGGVDSILNLFDEPGQTAGLSEWDRTYLDVLYDAFPERVNPHRQSADMARRVNRERREGAESASSAD